MPKRVSNTMTYVYLIAAGLSDEDVEDFHEIGELYDVDSFYLKVGISVSPLTRLSSLQTGSPLDLKLLEVCGPFPADKARAVERKLHDYLEVVEQAGGKEWAKVSLTELQWCSDEFMFEEIYK